MYQLSIVIPCYNEQNSINILVECCYQLVKYRTDVQFIFVNNGSTDNTGELLRIEISKRNFLQSKIINVPINKGYGYGIIVGLNNADTKILAWTHADLQTDPKDVVLAYDLNKVELDSNQCIVKGKRVGRNIFDNIFTAGMSFISSLFLNQKLWDINAQPKVFNRDFMNHLENAPHDFSLDLYMLFVANRIKMPIKSFPVIFSNRQFGEAKGGGSLIGKFKLIKRTMRYILKLRSDLIKGNR